MSRYLLMMLFATMLIRSHAATTIDPTNNDAYGANTGWINFTGDGTNGAIIGEAFCSGYIYSANCGWIHLGDGTPTNGAAYSNDSAADYGINHDGAGTLTGYAYGANIGWINFEQTRGQPQVDLISGALSGFIYSANTGWISLSNASAHVQTDSLAPGPDTDADGIPDWWEMNRYGKLTVLNGTGDWDQDGVSDLDEYRADTHPDDNTQFLYLSLERGAFANILSWNASPTRTYRLQSTTNLVTGTWSNHVSGLLHSKSGDLLIKDTTGGNAPSLFYRINAARPFSE